MRTQNTLWININVSPSPLALHALVSKGPYFNTKISRLLRDHTTRQQSLGANPSRKPPTALPYAFRATRKRHAKEDNADPLTPSNEIRWNQQPYLNRVGDSSCDPLCARSDRPSPPQVNIIHRSERTRKALWLPIKVRRPS